MFCSEFIVICMRVFEGSSPWCFYMLFDSLRQALQRKFEQKTALENRNRCSVLPWEIKFFVSDLRVLFLVLAFRKPWQPNLFASRIKSEILHSPWQRATPIPVTPLLEHEPVSYLSTTQYSIIYKHLFSHSHIDGNDFFFLPLPL